MKKVYIFDLDGTMIDSMGETAWYGRARVYYGRR